MEKKRRARINVSLEQLKSLMEKHYSHQVRLRWGGGGWVRRSQPPSFHLGRGAEHPSGFRSCLPGVSQLLRRGDEVGGGLRCPLVPERAAGSTMDSAGLGQEAPALFGPCTLAVWAPAPAAGRPRSPPPPLLVPGSLPGSSASVPPPQPASSRCAESPGLGLRVWRPW
uniref:Hes family bHLH transcription factor 3 n=1 Tax=Nomascus leucogenys TaxID=61853 RepID=A0A2I3HLL0_NOMLE